MDRERERNKEIHYKDLSHAILEGGKSQDLLDELVSWRPRRVDGVVLARKSQCFSSRPKTRRADVPVRRGRTICFTQSTDLNVNLIP